MSQLIKKLGEISIISICYVSSVIIFLFVYQGSNYVYVVESVNMQ
jgi:hypothetical protein